ncbi:MAG: radical SAM protein [Chloroflexota bacterium]|nr:radical SAM protein [Chloroflexota bacterium]
MVRQSGINLPHLTFEMGPSRPPSEAHSLLLRITRGCPWHRCEFCSSHRTSKLSMRSAEEIKKDIDTIKIISDNIKELSWKLGYGGNIRETAAAVYENPPTDGYRIVALWLHFGGERVFLQDADSLIIRTQDMVEVLTYLKSMFPSIKRVTTYGRSKTAAMKSLEELKEIHDAGLTRLHVGLESGSDQVLEYVQKGVTAQDHVIGGQKAVAAGISVCDYVMPGLGGKRWTKEHVSGTAEVLNQINPDFIRLRSLMIRDDIPLFKKWAEGDFELLTDDEVVEEIAQLIQKLEVTSYLASDHIENLLQEVEGQLPSAKNTMLNLIRRYQSLPPEDNLNYRFGRRAGYYASLDDLGNPKIRSTVDSVMDQLITRGDDLEEIMFNLKKRFLV